MYCIEESTCDIVGTFRHPPVIQLQGHCAPLPPCYAPGYGTEDVQRKPLSKFKPKTSTATDGGIRFLKHNRRETKHSTSAVEQTDFTAGQPSARKAINN